MNQSIRRIIICLALLAGMLAAPTVYAASDVSVKARLDSAYLLMGKQTAVHLEIVGSLDGSGAGRELEPPEGVSGIGICFYTGRVRWAKLCIY